MPSAELPVTVIACFNATSCRGSCSYLARAAHQAHNLAQLFGREARQAGPRRHQRLWQGMRAVVVKQCATTSLTQRLAVCTAKPACLHHCRMPRLCGQRKGCAVFIVQQIQVSSCIFSKRKQCAS